MLTLTTFEFGHGRYKKKVTCKSFDFVKTMFIPLINIGQHARGQMTLAL